MFIHCRRVSFSYPTGCAEVLRDVDLTLSAGIAGVIGPNGSGKTTLLRLIAGELAPTVGRVEIHPAASRVVLCSQTVVERPPDAIRLAQASTGDAIRLRASLRLGDEQLAQWELLSPGAHKRWQIGTALYLDPDVLLLDEPTNHLDAEGRALIGGTLRGFRGIGLLVSHDRELLNAVTMTTVRVHEGGVSIFHGPYDQARTAWEGEEARRRAEHTRLEDEERRLSRRLTAKRLAQRSAVRRIGVSRHGRADSESRTMAAKNRVRRAEARLGRDVRILRHRLEAVHETSVRLGWERKRGARVRISAAPAPVDRLLSVNRAELGYGERHLVRDLHVTLERGSRVFLTGPNGCGKTTLLRTLVAAWHWPDERLLYLPQELDEDDFRLILDEVKTSESELRGRILQRAAALGIDPDRLLGTTRLSPGEARKLLLAIGLGREVWALVLDEPTNHLDLPSIERVEAALAEFQGALILVTHDLRLARRVCRLAWRIEDRSIVLGNV